MLPRSPTTCVLLTQFNYGRKVCCIVFSIRIYLPAHLAISWSFSSVCPVSCRKAPCTYPRSLPLCHFNTLFTCVLPPFCRMIPEVSILGEVTQESPYSLFRHALCMGTLGIRPDDDMWSPFFRPVSLNRRVAARYRALGSVIPGRERFSWNLSF